MIATLKQYLSELLEITTKVQVIVFGSFITQKEQPNDIDILLSCYDSNGYNKILIRLLNKQYIEGKPQIHIFTQENATAVNGYNLIYAFNEDKNNKIKGIEIKEFVEII
jgi:predicted nucleotidyltransferase